MGAIEDKTTRELVEDRDLHLAAKVKEIAGLHEQIASLQGELKEAWKHPLSEDEKKTKRILSDYQRTEELMVGRLKQPLGNLDLFDVVRNHVVALDMIREHRDECFSALKTLCAAADEARKTVGESPKRP